MTSIRLSVVIPTRDRPDHLAACLGAVDAQILRPDEVIVVDDASDDRSAVEAVVARSDARLVRGEGRGPAAARNRGVAESSGDVVCFTDDDCRPLAGWLVGLAAAIEAGAEVVAGPMVNGRPSDPYAAASQTVINHLTNSSREGAAVGFAPTANLAVRADVIRRVAFDESFPLAAGEDREWCDRLRLAGYPIVFAADAVVEHHQLLGWRGFWRQQANYGRGGARLRDRPGDEPGLQSPRFYVDLVRTGFASGARVGALVLLAQVATAAGAAAHRFSTR